MAAVAVLFLGGCGSAGYDSAIVESESAPKPPVVVEARIVTQSTMISGDDHPPQGDPGPAPSDDLTWDDAAQGWVGEAPMLQFVVETSEDTGDTYCLSLSEDSVLQSRDGEASLHCAGMAEREQGTVEFLLSDFDVEADELVGAAVSLVAARVIPVDGMLSALVSELSHPVQVVDHR